MRGQDRRSGMNTFVDIHSHVLPGLDDGPEDLEAALDMARAAASSGTRLIVATPHLRADFPAVQVGEIATRCAQFSAEAQAAGIQLTILPAAEASLTWALDASDDELRRATFAGRGTDLLVETPVDVSSLEPLLFRVRVRGVRVTLAHPERSGAFQQEPERVERLSEQGILLQVNADSLLRKPGSPRRTLAEHLCREGLAQAIASDGHRAAEWRPVSVLTEGIDALADLVGRPRAEWMAQEGPAAIVFGAAMPPSPDIGLAHRSRWALRRR
jgi:protein-tyrosine phosphatase